MRDAVRYELDERIGAGGMAEAFLARRISADGAVEPVVVKKILPALSGDPAFRQMFIEEAQIASSLEHPRIVRFIDFGRIDDQLFLAMELIDGVDVTRLVTGLRPRKIGAGDAVRIVVDVLEALHFAHEKAGPLGRSLGIVHRDVSAGNVLVSKAGEAKLSDFGIAKAATRANHTESGVVRGNPRFMSPEQIRGDALDRRTDLYSTALLLHMLLTGVHPFEGDTLLRAVYRCMHGEIPPPSSANRAVPKALDAIVMRALSVDRDRRFEDAAAFASALTPHLPAGRSTLAALVRDVAPVRSGSAKGAGPVLDRAREKEVPDSDESVYVTRASAPADPASIAPLARLPARPAPADSAAALLARPFEGHSAAVASIAITADGKRLLSASHDASIRVWAFPAGGEVGRLAGHTGPVASVAVSGDGSIAVSGGRDRTVRAWDVRTRRETRVLGVHDEWVFSVGLSFDGRLAISGGVDRTIRAYPLQGSAPPVVIDGLFSDVVSCVALTPDGKHVLAGSYDRSLCVVELDSGRVVRTFESDMDSVRCIAVAPDGRGAVSGGADNLLRMWDLVTGEERWCAQGHSAPIAATAFSSDGRFVVSGSWDRTVRIWGAEGGYLIRTFEGHTDEVMSVLFSPDASCVISGGADKTIRTWDLSRL